MAQRRRQEFTLQIRDQGDADTVFLRLRAALKRLLRSHEFRCTKIVESTPGGQGKGEADAASSYAAG